MWHTMWWSCSAWWYKVLTQSSTAHRRGLLLLAGEVHTLSYFTMTISADTTTMLSLHYYHYHDVTTLHRPHHVLSRVFHAYYGCHHRHVGTVLALPAPCTIMSVPCLLWLPPTTCIHPTTSGDTKDRGILCGGRAVPGGARY